MPLSMRLLATGVPAAAVRRFESRYPQNSAGNLWKLLVLSQPKSSILQRLGEPRSDKTPDAVVRRGAGLRQSRRRGLGRLALPADEHGKVGALEAAP
jgi:hypothetical protein